MGQIVSFENRHFQFLIYSFYRIDSTKKLQVLFMRASGLCDKDFEAISNSLKNNSTLKVVDVSSNRDLTPDAILQISDILANNRILEYLGLSKLNLSTEDVTPLFGLLGRFPFPADEVEGHLAKLKARDVIVEKNKKLKSQKKPEEPVPVLDNIEQITKKTLEGEIVQEWVTIKNP